MTQPTEFGGRGGLIQRTADGHEVLTPGEAAQLMRAAGLKEAAGDRNNTGGTGPDAVFEGWTEEMIRAKYDSDGDAADTGTRVYRAPESVPVEER